MDIDVVYIFLVAWLRGLIPFINDGIYCFLLSIFVAKRMIHYFNPGHETAVQNGSPYYTAPANIVAMQSQLAFLPAWYADAGDMVLIDEFDEPYFSFISNIFSVLPKAIKKNKLADMSEKEVLLWGISPQAIYFFNEIVEEYDLKLTIPEWSDNYLYLNSRLAAHDCQQVLIGEINEISEKILPQFYTNLDDVDNAVNNTAYQLLAKAPYSSSGRGLLWLPETGLTRTERQILHGILKKQGSVSLEPVLNKQLDFAMEFMADGRGNVKFAGYSLFYTNKKGAYESNYLGSQASIEKQLTNKIPLSLLNRIKERIGSLLKEKCGRYKGCIGVDMLIYEELGCLKLHPCLEINMRYNMGYLSLKLFENYICPTSQGKFFIDFSPVECDIYRKHEKQQVEHPLILKDGRVRSGYLALCPVTESSKYRAYIIVE